MAKDLNVFDKEYGLLINGEMDERSEGKLLSLTTLLMAMSWPSSTDANRC